MITARRKEIQELVNRLALLKVSIGCEEEESTAMKALGYISCHNQWPSSSRKPSLWLTVCPEGKVLGKVILIVR